MLGAVIFGHAALPAGDPGDHRTGRTRREGAVAAAGAVERGAGAQARVGRAGAAPARRSLSRDGEAGAHEKVGAAKKAAARGAGRRGARSSSKAKAVLQGAGSGHRPRRHPGHRHAHRRAGHQDGPPDRRRGGRAAARARLRPVHPRRDPGAVRRDARHRAGRADHRRARRRVPRALHAALQFPALFGGRGGPHGLAGPARDRPRQAGLARHPSAAAGEGEIPLHAAGGLARSPKATAAPRWRPCAASRSR